MEELSQHYGALFDVSMLTKSKNVSCGYFFSFFLFYYYYYFLDKYSHLGIVKQRRKNCMYIIADNNNFPFFQAS
jgi:hypothetical protein